MFAIAIADQVADQRRVLAHVTRHRKHRLRGSERLVDLPPCDLSAKPRLQRSRHCSKRLHVRQQGVVAVSLDLQENLPIGVVKSGGPVRLRKSTEESLV